MELNSLPGPAMRMPGSIFTRTLIVLAFTMLVAGCSRQGDLEPGSLTCEYLTDPAVVDVVQPRLAWINVSSDGVRGQIQTAYQVRVASSRGKLRVPDLWDSGEVISDRSFRIPYEGVPLKSRQDCWWQVRVWDRDGKASAWSKPGRWRMGLLDPEDWTARWIGAPWEGESPIPRPPYPDARPERWPSAAPMLRKAFSLERTPVSAVAYVTGLGYFELWLNGQKISDDLLVPNQTNYGKREELKEAMINLPDNFREYRVMYLAYDLTRQLKKGENAIGAILGNGFYNPGKSWAAGYGTPRFLCQLHLRYSDGTEEILGTGPDWKVSKSPILMEMVYWGETYDAGQEQTGWCTVGFDDSGWEQAVLRDPPAGKLVAHTARTDRVVETLSPVSIEKIGEGNYHVDFGTEISGRVRLKRISGDDGQVIMIRFNGNEFSGGNIYICSGEDPASYAPRFNWFVFSGVEITGWPGELTPDDLSAEVVHTQIDETATFETSNELFNSIQTIWKRSQTDNMHGGIASDCPHRERSGYTGDGQLACITVLHNYDARNFYQKWMQDILGAQDPETGYVPNGAPWQPGCGGGPAWGAAICVIPWEYYVHYGSEDMLRDNFEGMKGYVQYMLSWTGEDGIMHSQRTGKDGSVLKWFNLGEWAAPGATVPDELIHTFYLWYCADITSRTAAVLGKEEEATIYRNLAERTKKAFHNRFFNEGTGSYGDSGGNILALKMGVPDEQYKRVFQALKENLRKTGRHLDTGITGTRFFFEVLADHGMNDLAYEAMNQRTEPGFGHWVELGSTTTREHWDESGSHNHPMFGGGLSWFYRNLAGMRADPAEPGYRHIIFKPQPVRDLNYVTYKNQTSYGEAGIEWRLENGLVRMNITVPVSCHATVYVPTGDDHQVTEGGLPASEVPGIGFKGMEQGYAVYEVGSGTYDFRVR